MVTTPTSASVYLIWNGPYVEDVPAAVVNVATHEMR